MLGTLSSIQNFLNKEGFHEAAKALERECREQGLHLPAKENLLLSRELGRFSRSDSAREATGSGASVGVLSPSRTRVCSLVPSTAEPVTRELKTQADPRKVISAPSRPAPKNQGNAWLGAAQPKASTIRMSPFPLQLRRQEEGQGGARCWVVAEAEAHCVSRRAARRSATRPPPGFVSWRAPQFIQTSSQAAPASQASCMAGRGACVRTLSLFRRTGFAWGTDQGDRISIMCAVCVCVEREREQVRDRKMDG